MPFTDLVDAAKCVVKALFIREKYINRSMQNFWKTTAHALQELGVKPLELQVYDDVPETPVDAGMTCKQQKHILLKVGSFRIVNILQFCAESVGFVLFHRDDCCVPPVMTVIFTFHVNHQRHKQLS